jgi:hypothetical protein
MNTLFYKNNMRLFIFAFVLGGLVFLAVPNCAQSTKSTTWEFVPCTSASKDCGRFE